MTTPLETLRAMATQLGHKAVGPNVVPDPQRKGAMVEAVAISVLDHFHFVATLYGAPGHSLARVVLPVKLHDEWVRQFHEAGLEGAHQQTEELKFGLWAGRTVMELSLDEQRAPRMVYFVQVVVIDPTPQGLQRLADALTEMSGAKMRLDAYCRLRTGLDTGVPR